MGRKQEKGNENGERSFHEQGEGDRRRRATAAALGKQKVIAGEGQDRTGQRVLCWLGEGRWWPWGFERSGYWHWACGLNLFSGGRSMLFGSVETIGWAG